MARKRLLIYPPNQRIGKYFTVAVLVLAIIVLAFIVTIPQVKTVPALIGLA
nr:hypothetical protein [Enterovibrio coralii]